LLLLFPSTTVLMQAADTAAIRAAITEEARSQGIEHTLKEERPPVARRGLRLPADLLGGGNEQLLQLLQQAFDGQMPGLQVNVSAGGQGSQGAAAAEDEVGAARCHNQIELRWLDDMTCAARCASGSHTFCHCADVVRASLLSMPQEDNIPS
jgi:hypothetical protein